jgi:hypothetical protein
MTVVVIACCVFYYGWYDQPHPRVRTILQFRDSQIVAVEGVSVLGWLTDCETGTARHVTGDYSLTKTTIPIVCPNEPHYQEWAKTMTDQPQQESPSLAVIVACFIVAIIGLGGMIVSILNTRIKSHERQEAQSQKELKAQQHAAQERQRKLDDLSATILEKVKQKDWAFALDLLESKFKLGERLESDVECYHNLMKLSYGDTPPYGIKALV